MGGVVSGYFRHGDPEQEEDLGLNLNAGKKTALGKSTENSSKKKTTVYGDLSQRKVWTIQRMKRTPKKPVSRGRWSQRGRQRARSGRILLAMVRSWDFRIWISSYFQRQAIGEL